MTRARRSVLFGLVLACAALQLVAGCSGLDPNPPDPHVNEPIKADVDGGADASEDSP